ncbi:phosphodiesterase, MJ0936 family [Petrotoga mobilis SJ95]|uniref:Phosphoesterase n=1 Tax=Petrotoga mobilis (strain DSM 10674 / SJ95) TaxID=403833 RepID=A9BHC6_PETMO|nr:YfcE family phosphodiesterase [Petrotoga mobilis]ABX31535.1 phosphodiesterase, MJ0936 family [Petrotoga mobilis SJ95]
MKILVISDLHIPIKSDLKSLDKLNFGLYDQIFLLGDIVDIEVLNYLENQKPILHAVYGNMDDFYIKNRLPEKLYLELFDKKIGLIHGHQTGRAIPEKLLKYFNKKIDLMVFGHSHYQEKHEIEDTLILNPGAFCEGEYAEIELNDSILEIKLLHL